jgi:membrane protease YdiL (CAAX protease family)
MDTEPEDLPAAPPPLPPGKTWVDRAQALFEVLLLAGLVSSLFASIPFILSEGTRASLLVSVRVVSGYLLAEAAITLALLAFILRVHRETLRDFGLSWTRWRSEVLIGIAVVPLLFVVNALVSVVFRVYFPQDFLERNPLTELIRTPQDLALFIGTALIAGGIKEELQRAFILRRFQASLGGANLGLIIWSVAFGAGHYVQGTQGMIAAGMYGFAFGILYLTRGSLIAPIMAHGAYDTFALLGYWFFGRQS